MQKVYNEPKLEIISFNLEEKIMAAIEPYNAEGDFGDIDYPESMNLNDRMLE